MKKELLRNVFFFRLLLKNTKRVKRRSYPNDAINQTFFIQSHRVLPLAQRNLDKFSLAWLRGINWNSGREDLSLLAGGCPTCFGGCSTFRLEELCHFEKTVEQQQQGYVNFRFSDFHHTLIHIKTRQLMMMGVEMELPIFCGIRIELSWT